MQLVEQTWRRGAQVVRPFCAGAQVRPRGFSRRLQRIVVDFGADDSFAAAAAKVREHYGVLVAAEQIRQYCWRHARRLAAASDDAPAHTTLRAQGPAWIVAEADGSMVPVVSTAATPPGADRREHRQLCWHEMRLVAAQAQGSATTHYDATLGSVEEVGRRWSRVVGAAGWALDTRIHGLGDGAAWIVEQCRTRFGACARYTVDLYHACDYLAAAAPNPDGAAQFVRDHREALRASRSAAVLAHLRPRLEPAACPDELAPVRRAVRYFENRPEQLDYAAALAADLPVGSGLIESGNRHVLQARLKIPGAWWTATNAHLMAQLRVCRANGHWDQLWRN